MPKDNNSKKKKTSFSSSNKSPYAAAGNLLTKIIDEKSSFKRLVYSKEGTLRCSKTTYAQVCQVLTYKSTLDQVLEQVPSLRKDIHNSGLLYVLVYELLLGPNKAIQGGGVVKRKIVQHETKLRKVLEACDVPQPNQQHKFPRYARVNTLLTSTEKVCQELNQHKEEPQVKFYVDSHIPDLLVFPPNLVTQIKGDDKQLSPQQEAIQQMIDKGELILQDKSSCLTALCLVHGYLQDIPSSAQLIDACAAPGNKTQHLAALLGDKKDVTIQAFDRSEERLNSMAKRMQQLAPSSSPGPKIVTQVQDFLKTNPKDYSKVKAILLDPSCSGSGIYTAPDRWTESNNSNEMDKSRVESLANFQEMTLKHAMSFPSVTRIVYSTCSLHDRENEMVVRNALKDNAEWKIVAPKCLQHWERRGKSMEGVTEAQAKCMIRACDQDETNGFFVCCLERTGNPQKGKTSWKAIVPPKGVKLYGGQFLPKKEATEEKSALSRTAGSKKEMKETPKKAVNNKKQQKSKTKKDEKEPQHEGGKEASNTKKSTAQDKESEAEKARSKKAAKKVAWKKRQLEQKRERLEKQKKLKTTPE